MIEVSRRLQWMPLHALRGPFRERLAVFYNEFPHTIALPQHVDLSTSVELGEHRLLWVSGQVCRFEGVVRHQGVVGVDVSLDEARSAARLSLLNLISIIGAACDGDLSRVDKFIRLTGYVCSGPDFHDHAHVIDAASEVINAVLGERGRHVRSAVGVASLPGRASVELECVVQIRVHGAA